MKYTGLLTSIFSILIFLCQALFPQASTYYRIDSETANELVISFRFPEPTIFSLSKENNLSLLEIPGLSSLTIPEFPVIPVLNIPLSLAGSNFSIQISVEEKSELQNIRVPKFITGLEDSSHLSTLATAPAFRGQFPEQIYRLHYLGLFRDAPTYTLTVFPIQVQNGNLIFYRKFVLKILLQSNLKRHSVTLVKQQEKKLLSNFFANKNVTTLPAKIQKKKSEAAIESFSNTAVHRARLIVKEKGIYRVTGEDLLKANIDIESIDPNTLSLTNRGKQVPFFVEGEVDGKFDPQDYIEFWGEPLVQTMQDKYPDLYVDPFSDENVYWLQWGGQPGIRMVEESGSIITNDPTKYNPAPFYSKTIHVEKNQQFERLGFGSVDHLSYTRDLWFFDGGVKAIGKKQYPFEIIYPDSSSFNPVDVTVMLSGKSFQGPAHKAMVWLNDNLVGSQPPNWFGQDTARITNKGHSNIRSFNLKHGENTLELQLTQQPTNSSDIVLLNWFEVTYDKQYRAFNNYIEFKRPAVIYFPNVDLFQFEIRGFTRRDIEIYKKGISKIVNFQIEPEETNQGIRYRIKFQDRVLTDDVEYIALTPERKKKPVRIELDEPFDPDNPTRTLKDPTNSADYLIITHDRFYQAAREYLKYRLDQGWKAKLIRVQDIYDEFNYGIKSPLAIKEFLRYAYRNWDPSHKLKYVLFLGDANFNYKISNTGTDRDDFVPTFFYQTYKFGASATDFPYSLVSGNDYVPDIFVGRIPVMTNGDVIAVLEKLKEYEQNPPRDPWRNQGVFISGNDSYTFEFENPQTPLFRSQNSRVLEMLFPRRFSAFRLNTVKNPNLSFDPNFGGTTDLIEYFDDGVSYVNFMGHGGGAIWADVQLFNLQDVDRLNNKGRYPFISSMTCFTGAFDNPGNMGLAQKFVITRDKGAIGVLASSGLGWAYNDYAILWAVDQFLFNPELTVGEAVNLGKIQYLSTGEYFAEGFPTITRGFSLLWDEMIHQYNLIADPVLRLQRPDEELKITLNNNLPQPGDTVQVHLEDDFGSGEGYIEIADKDNQIVNRIPIFTSSSRADIPLQIPADFPPGTGIIRAYLSNGQTDASGYINIGVNFAVLDSVKIEPRQPTATDSVALTFYLNDIQEIRRVYLIVQSLPDTFYTTEIAPHVYRTRKKIPPTFKIKSVFYTLYVENSLGNRSSYRNLRYSVTDVRPDPFIYARSIKWGGTERVQVELRVGNAGTSPAENVQVAFFNGHQNFIQNSPFAVSQVSVSADDSVRVGVDFPFSLNQSKFKIYARLNIPSNNADFNLKNNLDSTILSPQIFNVTPDLGSTYDSKSSDTLQIGSYFKVYVPAGAVNVPSGLRLEKVQFEAPGQQKGIHPIPVETPNQFHALKVQLTNPGAHFQNPYKIQIQLNPGYIPGQFSLEQLRLYNQTSERTPWTFVESSLDTSNWIIQSETKTTGLLAPFLNGDFRSPDIELTVDGRPIKKHAQVSKTPTLYLVIEDESGININEQNIRVLIDDQLLSRDKMFIPDTAQQSDIVGLTLYPELENGKHRLEVQVKDVNGNFSTKEFELVVSENFELHVFGNYPNPFSDETIFSYFVSPDVLDKLEIRIYTISGRLIRVITDDINTVNQPFGARAAGYNELMWDGKDEDGVEVANGVYFAVIRAEFEGKVKEKILKVARLK